MNNVTNRKMFRPRNARNKLNAMGGIMASSAPLMQAVQRFANGTQVNLRPGPSTISKFGQVMTPTGYGVPSSFPYNRTTAPQTNPSVQKVIANNLAAQRALNAGIADMPATELVKQDPDSQGFFNRLNQDIKQPIRSFVGDLFSPDPEGRAKMANTVRGIVGLDPISGVQPKVREGIQTITEDAPMTTQTNTSMEAAENLSAPTYTVDDIVYQSGDTRAAFSDDAGMTTPGMIAERDLLNESPESLDRSAELPIFLRTGEDKAGSEEDVAESRRISDSLLGGDLSLSEAPKQKEAPKDKKGITEQANPEAAAAAATVKKVQPTNKDSVKKASTDVGARIMKFVQQGDVDGAEEVAASAFGADEAAAAKAMSTEDRINRQRDIIAKVMGVNPEQYKQDRGMAIANFGFALMQKGIGEAGQQLVADLKANNAAQRAREDQISSAAISTVLGREEKEADRQFTRDMKKIDYAHDWRKLETVESGKLTRLTADMNFRGYINDVNNALKLDLKDKDVEMFNARLSNEAKMLADRIASAEKIASDNNLSQDDRNRATIESANARAVLSGLGDGTKLALIEGQQNGLTGTELNDFVATRGKELAATSTLTGPDSLRRMITTVAPQIMKEEGVGFDEAVSRILDSKEIQQFFSSDLAQLGITPNQDSSTIGVTKDPNTLSEAELKNLWDSGARIITFNGVNYPLENPDG